MVRLLIVSGHEALREGLAVALAGRGIDVVGTAGSLASGLDLLHHGPSDVALVDDELPDGSGAALTRELLTRRPAGFGVVLYAARGEPAAVRAGLAAGAAGFALKAGSADELVGALGQVATGGAFVDPRADHALGGPTGRPADGAVGRARLSPRERQVLELMAAGLTAEATGERAGVGTETVRTHVRNAGRKLGARNRTHAIVLALALGEIAPPQFPTGSR